GKVTNSRGEPLAGATVVIKRTKTGVNTDVNGIYLLKSAETTDTLIVSFLGYKTLTVPIKKRTIINIGLEEATSGLDEVVVQAYGHTTQRTTTGNIARVTSKDIEKQPVMNPLMALEGRVAGLIITPQSGYESGPLKVEIRGRNSVNQNFTSDPLYIIDGVPLTVLDVGGVRHTSDKGSYSMGIDQGGLSRSGGQSPLFNLNPTDIESIEVLKDADATSIYGSRGANGVILITTKRGKSGDNQFTLSAGQGVSFVTRYWDMLNTPQYLEMRREAFRNNGITPTIANASDITKFDNNAYTDWQKYAYGGLGNFTNIQTSLSGGNDLTTFRVSGGFNTSTDITTASGVNQRGSVAVNLNNHSRNQKFNLSLSANYGFSETNQISVSGTSLLPPNAPPVYDQNGNLNYDGWRGTTSFPFATLLQPYEGKSKLLTTNLTLNYTLLKGLVIRTSAGYNNTQGDQQSFNPIAAQDPKGLTKPTGGANFAKTGIENWIIEPQMEYNGLLYKGNLNVLVGATYQNNTTDALITNGTGYTSDALLQSITNAPVIKATNNYGQYKYAGVFARVGYNVENKYIVNFNGRRDGSSRFGPGNQFGNFASAGLAWIASEEKWLQQHLPAAVSLVKLRGSYGITGSDAVGDYQFLSQWGAAGTNPLSLYNGVSTLVPLIQPNADFHWQVNKKLEGALDLGFLKDRINLEAAYYRNRCDNQLIAFRTPDYTGFSNVTANSPANIQNSGLEFLLNAELISNKNFSWSVDFNIGFNKNKLLAYPDLASSPYYNQYKIGESLNNVQLLNYLGVDPVTGQYVYTDFNKDGKILTSGATYPGTGTDDRYVEVDMNPKYAGGLSNQFRYKNISLTTVFSFRKQMGRNAVSSTAGGFGNISVYQYDNRWQYPGQNALYARLTTTPVLSDQEFSSSTAAYTDASFIRLQTVALSYALPVAFLKKIGVKNCSLNMNAQNLFVLTRYKGLDPEVQNFGGMPPVRTITGGLTCSF
ncbi:MAG TPA: SusC/RagA family TonB-linked outer membrane protein, partial [Pedobacter sp.]